MSSNVPKAVLYYASNSIWSAAALLTLAEKGYGDDEVDLKLVDLGKGENYSPSFLRLNPKATVPTLVVPLQKTLSSEVESRYKAVTDTKTVVEFLDKSRSPLSHTHTTSTAPAPALAPATIAFAALSNKLIEILHSDDASPNHLFYANARDFASLRVLAKSLTPILKGKQQALVQYLAESESGIIHVSEKTRKFWQERKEVTGVVLEVLEQADKEESKLDADEKKKREDYLAVARTAWEVSLKNALLALNKEIVGPYALGEQLSLADMHLAAWLARLVWLAGGKHTDDGDTAITKLEDHIGGNFRFAKDFYSLAQGPGVPRSAGQSKLSAFWDAMKERPSWQNVYKEGLH